MQPVQTFRNASTQRTALFNKLKPCCLGIVQTVRKVGDHPQPGDGATVGGDLCRLTDTLYDLLSEQIEYDASVLDAALADYVFFPLLPILQHLHVYPARVLENATKCLRLLVEHGWKTAGLTAENAQRLLLLLTALVTGGRPPNKDGVVVVHVDTLPEETLAEGFRALAALLRTAGGAVTSGPLAAVHVVPALAHAVTVLLAGVTDLAAVPAVQLEALNGVAALYAPAPPTVNRSPADPEALAAFLPGTVSALVRLFALPGTLHTTPRRVIVSTLAVLQTVLVGTMGDMHTRRLLVQRETPEKEQSETASTVSTVSPGSKPQRDAAWLTATAEQVQRALATVLKLRNHAAGEVREAVHRLCICLLDECHGSLATCSAMLVESALVTATDAADRRDQAQTTLQDLAVLYPELVDVIKTTTYQWATGLPRAMQASDEEAKQRSLHSLQNAVALVDALDVDSAMLRDSLATALRDSVVTVLRTEPRQTAAMHEVDADVALLAADTALVAAQPREGGALAFQPVLLPLSSQQGTRMAVLQLLGSLGTTVQPTSMAAVMLQVARSTDGLDQVAAYWLAFELVQASVRARDEMDRFVDLGNSSDNSDDSVLEDLFSFSVAILASYADSTDEEMRDWRIDALALEVTAFAATRMGEAFRPELIDVLYPSATFLGASERRLRTHAITTLNVLARACGYVSVSDLVVANVDYMLNAVSLRLNTLDISPASTQVLTAMVRLAGPRLVPYLDDVVAALFAALDNYHGYPRFVESLFAVLGEVVQQSVRSSTLLIGDRGGGATVEEKHVKRPLATTSMQDLVDLLDRRAERRMDANDDDEDEDENENEFQSNETGARHPKQPWTKTSPSEADTLLRQHEDEDEDGDGDQPAADTGDLDKEGVAAQPEDAKTPTYALLARITTLTQHYLTAPAPTLRKALLDLLATAAPALAADEDAFLPLVNDVWPVAVARLYEGDVGGDGAPYVVVAACHALTALCASAGDFLASRIAAEWRARLGRWCVRIKAAAAHKLAGGGTVGGKTAATPSQLPDIRVHAVAEADTSVVVLGRGNNAVSHGDSGADLVQVAKKTTTTATTATMTAATSGLGRFAQVVQVWEAVSELLIAVVQHVRLDDDVYDAVLDLLLAPVPMPGRVRPRLLLSPATEQRARMALSVVNADAVWLIDYRHGRLGPPADSGRGGHGGLDDDAGWIWKKAPVLAGITFAAVVAQGH